MEYRIATHVDIPALARMNQQLIRDEGHRNPMTLPELEQRMAAWLRGEYEAVVFHEDAAELGYALYRHDPGWIYLRQLFVHREHRRKGIGRTAMGWLRANPWKNAPRIRVDVLVGNARGIAFWRSVGFIDYCMTLELDQLKERTS